MIVQGLIIVLIVLVVANFAVGIFNTVSPPCNDANEYFQGASRMPDGATAGLGSIPTHAGHDYVGAARFATGVPGTIGLTSYANQKNGYIGDTRDVSEGYINPIINELGSDDPSDCKDHQVGEAASNAIDAILQPGKKGKAKTESTTNISDKSGSLSEFEVSMEGIMSKNIDKSTLRGKHMSLAHQTARDGYTSRPGDKSI